MSPQLRRYDGHDVRANAQLRVRLGEVFAEAFSEPPYREDREHARRWAEGRLVEHAGAPGFRLVAAVQEDRLLGFAYGLLGGDDQWFTQTVRERVPAEVAQAWLGDHGELVELAVARTARGAGLGRVLHDEAVEGLWAVGARKALLVVDTAAMAARRLYASCGWVDLAEVEPGSMLQGLPGWQIRGSQRRLVP